MKTLLLTQLLFWFFLITNAVAADKRIPDLSDMANALVDDDLWHCVDVSDTSEHSSGSSRKCTATQMETYLLATGAFQATISFGTGVETFLGTPSSTNFFTALTGEGAFAATLLGYADEAAVLSGIGAQAALTNPVVQANLGADVYTFLGVPSTTNFFSALTGEGDFAATLLGYADADAVLSGIGAQATVTAGRSLTFDSDTMNVDSELYTDQECMYIEDPTADDDLKSFWRPANDVTLTAIWAESDQTVNFDLQIDDGTPADVNGTDLAPAAGTAEDTSLSGDTGMTAGDRLDLVITSVASTPTWISICWTYTIDD